MRKNWELILYVVTVLVLFTCLIVTQRVAEAQEGAMNHGVFDRVEKDEVVILDYNYTKSDGGRMWWGRPEIKGDSLTFISSLGEHWGTYAVDQVRLRSGKERRNEEWGYILILAGIPVGVFGAAAIMDTEDETVLTLGAAVASLPGAIVWLKKHPYRYIHLPDGKTVRAQDDDFMLELRRQIRRARGTALHLYPMRDGAGLGVSFTF